METGISNYADYYDQQAEMVAWHGPAVVFGLMYPYADAGQSLLDIGIGTGLGSVLFHRAGLRVFGMDNSIPMLVGARSKAFAQDLREHDMTSMPYPYDQGSFNHAICVGTLQFFAVIDSIFLEMGRVVRYGGMFGFTVVDRRRGEPTSFTACGEHTQSELDVMMYRHPEPDVRAFLKAAGFVVRADLQFIAFMNAERTAPIRMKAYVAQREPRT
jgi:ubiquinone/menaquinone biosynthesis C-methylase UbiE